MMPPASAPAALRDLAAAYGIQLAYRDAAGSMRRASPTVLLAMLRALGAPVARVDDADAALRARRRAVWQRPLAPVTVAWDGRPAELMLRLPAGRADERIHGRLALETGETRDWPIPPGRLSPVRSERVAGQRYVQLRLDPPSDRLPYGYHRLRLEWAGGASASTLVIAAPARAWTGADAADADREWGVFLPLYALRTARSWGIGDLTDLRALAEWTRRGGGSFLGTLPLLATFLDETAPTARTAGASRSVDAGSLRLPPGHAPEDGDAPFDPSPYAPVSRLFWNELYLDVTRAPELAACPSAQTLVNSTALGQATAALQRRDRVDYRRAMMLKRQVLEILAAAFFRGDGESGAAFRRWRADRPRLDAYARFRAATERRRRPWRAWPHPARPGEIGPEDYDPGSARYHTYVQWLLHRQLAGCAEAAASGRAAGLYLDFPLGVHAHGFDAWAHRDAFVDGATVGAPPDAFFAGGQDWGFPPPHPESDREDGYPYLRACLRNHLRYARALRIDHVMALHRLYCIPDGHGARDGVYLRYHAEEAYAVLCLESHRHGAAIIGEDLGTVPREVRRTMKRHGVQRMYVLPFEVSPDREPPVRPPPRHSLAGLGTHDTPPFAAFWSGADIDRRLRGGSLEPAAAEAERSARDRLRRVLLERLPSDASDGTDPAEALRACLRWLAASRARLLLVSLEDLWLETEPQNVPGANAADSWRRKAAYEFEQFRAMPRVSALLEEIDRLRNEGTPDP